MSNKSAEKRERQNANRRMHNRMVKSAVRTAIKKFDAAVVEGNRDAAESAYKVAVKTVDKAADKGLIHKNNAAHKKSAMTLKLNGLN